MAGKRQRKIGFLSPKFEEKMVEEKRDGVIITLDSGEQITDRDMATHTLITGTTGSGKTESGMKKIADGFFRRGCPGLVVAVKSNFGLIMRGVAENAGRGDDVIEFGTAESAVPINIISGMSRDDMSTFAMKLVDWMIEGQSNNRDFTIKGVTTICDIYELLSWMAKDDPRFEPTLVSILDMIANPLAASAIFRRFKMESGNKLTDEQRRLICDVESDEFHIMNQTYGRYHQRDRTHRQHITYDTHVVKDVLRAFISLPGATERLCCRGAGNADMKSILIEGKIAIFRILRNSGRIGEALSRILISDYYNAVYDVGSSLPRRSFVLIDEFQGVANLGMESGSDAEFISQSREFKGCFVGACQSLSALVASIGQAPMVNKFIANCNNMLMLYNNDPMTRECAQTHDPSVNLLDLQKGECFVTHYDADTMKHDFHLDSLNDAYNSMKDITPVEGIPLPPIEDDFESFIKTMMDIYGSDKTDETHPEFKKHQKPKRFTAADPDNKAPARQTSFSLNPWRSLYPGLFTDAAYVAVPKGWHNCVKSALDFYVSLGFEGMKIDEIVMGDDGVPEARGTNYATAEVLTRLLRPAAAHCVHCGKRIALSEVDNATTEEAKGMSYETISYGLTLVPWLSSPGGIPMCADCLESFHINVPGQRSEVGSENTQYQIKEQSFTNQPAPGDMHSHT